MAEHHPTQRGVASDGNDSDGDDLAETLMRKLERFHLPDFEDGMVKILLPNGDVVSERSADTTRTSVGHLLNECGRYNATGVGHLARLFASKLSRSRIRGPFATKQMQTWNIATVSARRGVIADQIVYQRKNSRAVLEPGIYTYEPRAGCLMRTALSLALLTHPPYLWRILKGFLKSMFGAKRFVIGAILLMAITASALAVLYVYDQMLETWFAAMAWVGVGSWLVMAPSLCFVADCRRHLIRWKLRAVKRAMPALSIEQAAIDSELLQDRTAGIPEDYGVVCTFQYLSFPCLREEKRKTDKFVNRRLRNVHGAIIPGRVTAIMGASGSGKSTFLRALADRFPSDNEGNLSNIRWNGNVTTLYYSSLIRFVYQHDMIYAEMTVGEVLMYSAKLQLPLASWATLQQRVAHVAKVCALTKLIDNRIGDDIRPGISGGQRRRVSIAIELLAEPQTLFLDEPTSGLDAASALELIENLHLIARTKGISVVMVIHQPRVEIFDYLDYLTVVVHGELLFYLSISSATALIERAFPSCKGSNIGDVILDVLEGKLRRDQAPGLDGAADEESDLIHLKRELAATNDEVHRRVVELHEYAGKSTDRISIAKPGVCRRLWRAVIALLQYPSLASVMLGRLITIEVSKVRLKSHFMEFQRTIGLALIVGFSLFQLGTGSDDTKHRINNTFFVVSYVAMNQAIGEPIFFRHYPYFLREYDYGTVRPMMFALMVGTFEAVKEIVHTFLFSGLVFLLQGLGDIEAFCYFAVICIITSNASTAILYMFSAITNGHEKDSTVIWIVCLTMTAYYAGFMIEKGDIPLWIQWVYWISPHKWSFDGTMHALFPPLSLDFVFGEATCDEEVCPISGSEVLNQMDMRDANKYMSMVVLLAFIGVFRILGYSIMRMKLFRPMVYPTTHKKVVDEHEDVTKAKTIFTPDTTTIAVNTAKIMRGNQHEAKVLEALNHKRALGSITEEEQAAIIRRLPSRHALGLTLGSTQGSPPMAPAEPKARESFEIEGKEEPERGFRWFGFGRRKPKEKQPALPAPEAAAAPQPVLMRNLTANSRQLSLKANRNGATPTEAAAGLAARQRAEEALVAVLESASEDEAKASRLRQEHPDYDNWQRIRDRVLEFDHFMQNAHLMRPAVRGTK